MADFLVQISVVQHLLGIHDFPLIFHHVLYLRGFIDQQKLEDDERKIFPLHLGLRCFSQSGQLVPSTRENYKYNEQSDEGEFHSKGRTGENHSTEKRQLRKVFFTKLIKFLLCQNISLHLFLFNLFYL